MKIHLESVNRKLDEEEREKGIAEKGYRYLS